MTETFMTSLEYAKYKGYETWAAFIAAEGYPTTSALALFSEDIWGWMVGQIGNDQARSNYDTDIQYKLRNIEYRGVELMISAEIEKDKVETYIKNAIVALFGDEDKANLEVVDDEIHRGVV